MVFLYSKIAFCFFLLFGTNHLKKDFRHPLHVSTTEINFNAKQKSLEINCRIFTDDFENILRQQNKNKIDLTAPAMHANMDELVKKYIQKHLQMMVNTKHQSYHYLGFEIDHEVVNIYLEIPDISALQKLKINNSILYDLFDDQMNIVHIQNGGNKKSFKLNFPSQQMEVSF